MHQFGPARLRPYSVEQGIGRALLHGALVDRELGMALDLGPGGTGAAGLEVDHVGAARRVAFDPVHAAPDADGVLTGAQRDIEVVLAADQLAAFPAFHHVPAQEAFQGGARVLLLLPRLPRRVEGQAVPDGVQPLHERGQVAGAAAGGHLVGQYVHHVAEALRGRGRFVRLDLPGQEPLQGAGAPELLQCAAGQRDGRRALAQRHGGAGGFDQSPPALRMRCRNERIALLVTFGRQSGQPPRGRVPQRG